MDDGENLEARQRMSMASFYAALAFTRAGVGYVHAISHNFGAYYHTPRGLANAIVMPYVLDYLMPACTARLADLAEASGLNDAGDSAATLAQKFIDHIRSLNSSFGIPAKLDALQADHVPSIARAALKEAHGTYAVPRYVDRPACESLVQQIMA